MSKPFSILLLLISTTGFAYNGRQGHVSDRQTLEKIAGATVRYNGGSVTCDQNGQFVLEEAGNGTLIVSATGYKTDTINIIAEGWISVSLEPKPGDLQDVVISANMRPVGKAESAIPVELYHAKFFKKNPTPNVFEALSTMNGVQPQLNCNICNTGDIHINGMEGPYTMVLIDGMPVISSLSRIYGFSGIPTSIVKRMEVVKGPASTLYGSDAVAGLINIITKDALNASKFSADISVSTLAEMNADFTTTVQSKKAAGIFALNLFNYWKKQDINHDNFTDVTQQRRISLFNKWDIDRKSKLPFGLSIRMMAENRWGGELNWNKLYRGSDSIYGESIVTHRAEIAGVYGLTGGTGNIKLDYSYSYHNQDSYYGTTKFFASQHVGFAQVTGNIIAKKHQLLWGIPLRFTSYDDNTFLTDKDNPNNLNNQLTAAAFLQDEWKIGSNLMVLSGLRYEYNNRHGDVFSPRLAVKWQTKSNHIFRLSGGNGYRIVNLFTEDHAALTGAREVVLKNDLAPERSWNANLNYTKQWLGKRAFINVDASLFYTRFTNKIIADYVTDPSKIIYDNLDGYAVSKGITTNFEIAYKKGPKLMAGITVMDVYAMEPNQQGLVTKETQMFAPVFSGNYSASQSLQKLNVVIDLTGKVYGSQRLPVVPNDFRPENSPWFSIMNLQVTKKTRGSFEYYVSVKNLLNFIPKDPILHPDDPFNKVGGKYFDENNQPRATTNPFGYQFDPSYSYAPMQGIKLLAGFRMNF